MTGQRPPAAPPPQWKTPLVPPAPECRFLGKRAAPPPGESPQKRWSLCGHPKQPLGPVVCPCKGCRPGCSGYDAGDGTVSKLTFAGHFNASVIEYGGRLLLATRKGRGGSRVYLSELAADLTPTSTVEVKLDHPRCRAGREDPRLFLFRGRLHMGFIGVETGRPGGTQTHQMVAELGDDFQPVNLWAPTLTDRQYPKEKNWVFFEGDSGELLSVYSIEPHLIHRHDGTQATEVARTSARLWWEWGHIRGGASPVRVGDEWYCWLHGTHNSREGGPYYTLGLYTFAAESPYRVLRWSPVPLLFPSEANDVGKRVVFPCGSVLRGNKWLVSYGFNDAETRFVEFDFDEVEERLVKV